MKLKPFYSIQELADLLEAKVHSIADGLVACGVPAFYAGKEVTLSKYECFRPTNNQPSCIYIRTDAIGNVIAPHSPDPRTVTVSTDVLPPLWVECINKAKSTDDKDEIGIEEHKTLPISECNANNQEIRGKTFIKLMTVIEAFPNKYEAKNPKLKDDVRGWLRDEMDCSDREAQVFGSIIAEHFNILGGTKNPKQ